MDIVSLVLSIIAILVSIVVAFVESVREYRLSRIGLEAEYFKDIYKEHLVYKIPNARGYIKFDSANKLIGSDKLIDELQQLRKDSLYFQYNNPTFYGKLKQNIQELENYLVTNESRVFVGEDQTIAYTRIKDDIENIYRVISKGYLGKK